MHYICYTAYKIDYIILISMKLYLCNIEGIVAFLSGMEGVVILHLTRVP